MTDKTDCLVCGAEMAPDDRECRACALDPDLDQHCCIDPRPHIHLEDGATIVVLASHSRVTLLRCEDEDPVIALQLDDGAIFGFDVEAAKTVAADLLDAIEEASPCEVCGGPMTPTDPTADKEAN
jgi:hypothetical protein